MNREYWKNWFKAASIRALKTVAQTAVASIGTCAILSEVNWVAVASASVLAGILSLLTSLAGIPEVEDLGGGRITFIADEDGEGDAEGE